MLLINKQEPTKFLIVETIKRNRRVQFARALGLVQNRDSRP